MKSLKVGFLSVLISITAITSAFAVPDIALVMENKKVSLKEGKEVLSDVKAARPGDILLYTIKVSNKGNSSAIEVEPIGNIPSNTIYVPENKKSEHKMQFSIDNGATFQDVPKITVSEKGKTITKNAPAEMYNRVKWIIKKVDPKQTYNLTYKVKVK